MRDGSIITTNSGGTMNEPKKNFYKNNLEALRKRYPKYADAVDSAYISKDYQTIPSKVNMPTLKVNNDYWYDKDNPVQCCADNIVSFGLHHCRLAVFLGFGIGYDPVFYTEQMSTKYNTDQMIVIEKDPALLKLGMKTFDLVPFFNQERIKIILTSDTDELFNVFTKYLLEDQRYYLLRDTQYFYNMMQFEHNKDFYSQVMDTFRRAAGYVIVYYGNDAKDSLVGYHNMFANLKEIINNPGINMLKDAFKGVPAVCVATGPSLDKNMHLLKGLEDKALIIAADASLKPMIKKGLKPHMVTSLEREMAVVDLFKDMPAEEYDDVYLCGCPVLYNEVYKEYKGPRLIAYRMFDHFKWLGIERGILPIKLSSGNMNFKIAEYLGCDPIILIGQDLALQGGKTNADGAALGTEQQSYLSEPRMFVRGNYVDKIETTRSLNMMLDAYIVDVDEYQGKCINATEGGAYIPKTKIMTFQEAIDRYIQTSRNIRQTLNIELAKFQPKPEEIETVKANITRAIESFRKSLEVCNEALVWIKDFTEAPTEAFDKFRKFQVGMQNDTYTWQYYFAHIAQTVFVNHEIYLNSILRDEPDIDKARIKAIKDSQVYFELVGGLIKICIEDLEGVQCTL